MLTLCKRLEILGSRLHQDSSNSSWPPSTDSPSTKRQRRTKAVERRQAGAKSGHPGHQQVLVEPTATVAVFPEVCACGRSGLANLIPYHTHQVIELPAMRPEVTHWMLHQGWCLSCGKLCKATVSLDQASGYGPRLTGFVGEMAGIVGASRSAVQALCASVGGIPLSKGAIQKRVAKRAIAGWRVCCRCVTLVAFGVVRRFPSWSKRCRVCSKARGLISAGSPNTSPCLHPLPRDHIPAIICAVSSRVSPP